jgi:hypothetical protein
MIQQQRLAYSFNTVTNTSFDAQNIVSEAIIIMAHLPTNQLHPDVS